MYESYWGLERKPFEGTSDPAFYYPSEGHQGALLKLRYAVESRRGCAVLAGPAGVGKTMLVHALRRQLGAAYGPIVHVVFPQMAADELLAYLADALEAPPAEGVGLHVSIRRIEQALQTNTAAGHHAVVVVDEAQLLQSGRTLETLRLMMNFEHESAHHLTLLLCGQPELLPTLDRMPALEERLAIKCLLRPLNADETAGYIEHRLRAAGARRTIFGPDAVDKLYELSHGFPRRINRLCDLALLVGFAEEQRQVGSAELDAVSRELIGAGE